MLVAYLKKYPVIKNLPKNYCLEQGHMKFFKNKTSYLKERHELLKKEMKKRYFKPTNTQSYTVTTSSPTFRAEPRQQRQDDSAQRRRRACINNCDSRMRQCANNCEPNPFTQWQCIRRCSHTGENCRNSC